MKKLYCYISPHKLKLTLQIIVKFAGTICDLFVPWILSYILDDIVPLGSKAAIYGWGFVMLLCAFGALLLNVTANRMAARISGDITEVLRHDLFDKVMRLSCRKTDEYSESSLISRLTSDAYFVYQMMQRMLRIGIRAPILLIGGCVVTLLLDFRLALVLIALLPVLGVSVFYISKKGVGLYSAVQKASDAMVLRVREFMSGIRVILALSKKEYERDKFSDINRKLAAADQRAGFIMAATSPVMNLILYMGLGLVLIVGAYYVNKGVTQPGKIIAFLTYFTIILNAMLSMTKIFVMMSKGIASADRIEAVLDSEDELAIEGDCFYRGAEGSPAVEFKNVSFSYSGNADNIHDISFRLQKGQTLGIIGATGSGKSTILLLLLRFYDADSGDILVDGVNIKSIPRGELYAKFGTVFQNDILFSGSIGENIDFGRGISEDNIDRAIKTAQASFIDRKENRLDYKLDIRAGNLSGGQKQRLLVARALSADPDILLLDDVSSALDYRTDAKLRRALGEKYESTTKIIVSQRVSTVMGCDLIIVLDKGRVTGEGTHNELMAACTEYAGIYNIQMGGAADEA